MLLGIVERRSSVTHRKSIVYVLKCDSCATIIEGCKVRYERSVLHFCDNGCRGQYRHDHPETCAAAVKAMHMPMSRARAKTSIQEKATRSEWSHWLGKHHTEATKQHLSVLASDGRRKGSGNGMFGRHHKETSKEAMSDSKTQLIIDGKFLPYGTNNKKGWYESVKTGRKHFFKSSWEEAVMKHLDNSSTVPTWDYECVRIPYYYHDNKRWYVPDFIVAFADGHREMWEVKPEEFLLTDRVKNTTGAGRQYCAEHGLTSYLHVTRSVLKAWDIYPT